MQTLRSITGKVLIESHKGAEEIAFPNSWEAIIAGHNAKADFLEIDIQQTRDRSLVVHGDYKLNGQSVASLTDKDLSEIKVNGKYEIVFLKDVLSWATNKQIYLTLDIKNGMLLEQQIFYDVMDCVITYNMSEMTVITSWDHVGLRNLNERYDFVHTRPIVRGRFIDLPKIVNDVGSNSVGVPDDLITSLDIKRLHDEGISVVVAVLYDKRFSRAAKIGADIICCSNPLETRKILKENNIQC